MWEPKPGELVTAGPGGFTYQGEPLYLNHEMYYFVRKFTRTSAKALAVISEKPGLNGQWTVDPECLRPLVTDEELAEVYASLGVNPKTEEV